MAREFRRTYQGSATLYTVLRLISDATVYNGSSFETWADGNIATYDIALTSRGGDLYDGDMPPGIAAGDYRAIYYLQAGGTPAITDLILGTEDFHWNGTAATSLSTATLSDYALTSLDALKRFMRLDGSDNDTLLTEIINAVSAYIEKETGRKFVARDYRERHNGDWQTRLQLEQRPVQTLTRVAFGAANALSISFTGSAIRANASIYLPDSLDSSGGLRLVSVDSTGTATKTNLAFATYKSVSALETQIKTISGWTASTSSNQPSRDLNPIIAGDALGKTVFVTYPDQSTWQYRLDAEHGEIQFEGGGTIDALAYRNYSDNFNASYPRVFDRGFQNFLVEYNAGYTTVPEDVELICKELAQAKYYVGIDDPAIKSEALGPYSVTFSDNDSANVKQTLKTYISGRGMIGGW